MKRLNWVEESGSGRYTAYNSIGEMLGYLEYERVGAFMHWCWYQFQDISMSPGCLEEVREKQKELAMKYKIKRTKEFREELKLKDMLF